jgi:hypothetical protein
MPAQAPREEPKRLPTLEDLFRTDFTSVSIDSEITLNEALGGHKIPIRRVLSFESGSSHVAVLVKAPKPFEAISTVIQTLDWVLEQVGKGVRLSYSDIGDHTPTDAASLVFARRLTVYHTVDLSYRELADLTDAAKQRRLEIKFRGPSYLTDKIVSGSAKLAPAPPRGTFTERDQTALTHNLRALRESLPGPCTVDIEFGNATERPLGKRLKALFDLAGWTVNYNDTAQEPWKGSYPGGTTVRGYNEFLVASVAEAMTTSGVLEVRTDMQPLTIPRDNPKYEASLGRVYVLLGAREELRP